MGGVEDFPQTTDEYWTRFRPEGSAPPHFQQSIVAYIEMEKLKARDIWPDPAKAATLSAAQPNASQWLTAVPDQPAYTLKDFDYRVAVVCGSRCSQ